MGSVISKMLLIWGKTVFALNTLYDLIISKFNEGKAYSDTVSNTAKTEAINEAEVTAAAYAASAQSTAISTAAGYTDTAKSDAISTSNTYTDTAIAGLTNLAQMGIVGRARISTQIIDNNDGTYTTEDAMPTGAAAYGITAAGHYYVEVELKDQNDALVFDKEASLEVSTLHPTTGLRLTTNVNVSTEDGMIVKVTSVNGSLVVEYVKMYEDRLREAFNQLNTRVLDQVSETELLAALNQVDTAWANDLYTALQNPNS